MFYEFFSDLYNRTFLVAVGVTSEELNEHVKQYTEKPFEPLDVSDCLGNVDVFRGVFRGTESSVIVIYLHSNEMTAFNLGTITHECIHAGSEVFKICGITHDLNNEEPYAYLVDWIFRQVVGAIHEHNAK